MSPSLFSLLLVSGFLLHSARQYYQERLEAALTIQAHLIADQLGPVMLTQNPEKVSDLAEQLGRTVEARVVVVDGGGRVLGDSWEDSAVADQAVVQSVTSQALAGPYGNMPWALATTAGNAVHAAVCAAGRCHRRRRAGLPTSVRG